MYHLRDVTLSFMMHKWQTYECPKDSLPKQGGLGWVSPSLGRGCLLTLHHNPLSSNKLRRTVKFFYLMQLFNNTISTHSEMYHHSLLRTIIAQIIWPFGNMFVLLLTRGLSPCALNQQIGKIDWLRAENLHIRRKTFTFAAHVWTRR